METNQQAQQAMSDQVARQVVRQLKIINFWITFFGSIFLIMLIIVGFLVFKVVTFVQSTEQRISDLQEKTTQSLTVKDDLCASSLLASTSYCQEKE